MKHLTTQITLGSLIAMLALTLSVQAKGGKPNKGAPGSPPAYGRADFVATAGHNIVEDGLASCSSGDHPLGGVWDYWDVDDSLACDPADGVQQSDFDTGGRWIFSTGHVGSRYLTFFWQPQPRSHRGHLRGEVDTHCA